MLKNKVFLTEKDIFVSRVKLLKEAEYSHQKVVGLEGFLFGAANQ